MKRTLIALAVTVLLAGCGGGASDIQRELDNADSADLREQVYLDVLREEYPDLYGMSDAELIQGGKQTCEYLEELDLDFDRFIDNAVVGGVDAEFAGAMLGVAIPAFCPQYIDAADRWSNG